MKKILSTFLFTFILFGCSQTTNVSRESDNLKVVTTFAPLYAHADNIGGEKIDLANLLPPGSSIHTWQPTPQDIKNISEADILVINGLGLEEFLDDAIDAAQNPDLIIVDTSSAISSDLLLEYETKEDHEEDHDDEHEDDHERGHDDEHEEDHDDEHEEDHDDEHEEDHDDEHEHHHHNGPDPHIWLSPQLTAKQASVIADTFAQEDPENKDYYIENKNRYINELIELDNELIKAFENVNKKDFIVYHDAYTYFLTAYNLKEYQKNFIQKFPQKETTSQEIQEIAQAIQEENIETVFTEPQFSPKIVQVLQEEYQITAIEIDPIGSEITRDGYINNMRNLKNAFLKAFE